LAIQLGVVFETVDRHLSLLADLDEARDIPCHKTARSWLAQFSAASILNTGGKGSLREGRIAQMTAAPAVHWAIPVHLKHGGTQLQRHARIYSWT